MNKTHGPIGNLVPNKSVMIVGAGISGLLMGYYLKKQNIPFTILEKETSVGGKIGTNTSSFGLAEKSANAVFSNDDVIALLDDLKIPYFQANRKLKKFVWRQGSPHSPPIRPLEILLVLFSLFKRIPSIKEMSIKDFFKPLMGEKVCNEVLAPGLGGVYAHDIEDLHLESIFKNMDLKKNYLSFLLQIKNRKKNQITKATSISFSGGMQTLINELRKHLQDHIKVDSVVNGLQSENTIICTNAHEAGSLLEATYPSISLNLKRITYKSVSTGTLITETPISFLKESFGILFPPKSKVFNSLGILSNSEIYPDRTTLNHLNSYTFIVKGTYNIEEKIESDIQLLSEEKTLSSKKELVITKWDQGIPLYDLSRFQTIAQVRTQFKEIPKGLVLFGNYIDGISIREILSMAKEFSEEL
jgi:oxygen-dependent protoporphyrinogen oxidase